MKIIKTAKYKKSINWSDYNDVELDFAAKLGLGPKYVPEKTKTYKCPKCNKKNAYFKEIHPDTDMNDIVLYCPDCKYSAEEK